MTVEAPVRNAAIMITMPLRDSVDTPEMADVVVPFPTEGDADMIR